MQLEIINNDLDAEMKQRTDQKNHKIYVRNVRNEKGNPIRTNQEEKTDEKNDSNLSKVNVEETDHMLLYKKILKFYYYIGSVFGWTVTTKNWKPYKHVMVYATTFFLLLGLFSMFRAQYNHYCHGEYIKILELCSLYGMAVSVIYIL